MKEKERRMGRVRGILVHDEETLTITMQVGGGEGVQDWMVLSKWLISLT